MGWPNTGRGRHVRGWSAVLLCGMFLAACGSEPPPPPIPPVPPIPEADGSSIHVVVTRGQTLDRIAQIYHVTKEQIIGANELKPPYALPPGTILTIPLAAMQSPKPAKAKASAAPAHRAKPKEPEPEDVIPLDDVPTHSLPMPKTKLPGVKE